MEIIQKNKFKQAYKKLAKNVKIVIDEAIQEVAANPRIGKQKTGALSWLRVYKFKCLNQQMLLGYLWDKDIIVLTLVDVGSHENFYRDIKTP